jgi:adenosylcobinamide kinase/adenosylcobinamide-phosphate guanylyltransferase
LLDCLTLWISNLLLADQAGTLGDGQITALADEVLAAARPREGQLIMVSGEVGGGLVSENALARRYQDLVGRCNQVMAAGATQVIQVVCGIPVIIKR